MNSAENQTGLSNKVPLKVRESLKKINLGPHDAWIRFDEPLSAHSTFRVGGPADIFARPLSITALTTLIAWAKNENVPVFILGGGANVLVADKGIRGLVIETGGLDSCTFLNENILEAQAGISVSDAAAQAADQSLAGLDFIYSMPGSLGGAVYMNARCYGSEIADILISVDYLNEQLQIETLIPEPGSFQYKNTPFQGTDRVILSAKLKLKPGNRDAIWQHMKELEADRRAKGHFNLPCAGSVFKNNHEFGQPSGKIIDSVGLRGLTRGGAKVSDGHANIIVNTGNASATDIRGLVEDVHSRVLAATGFDLEAEVLMIGEWD